MAQSEPICPECRQQLALKSAGDLDFWACPAGHGLGFTMSEAYGRLQDDEIAALWAGSEQAPVGTRPCPFCTAPMVSVTIAVDADESSAAAPGAKSVTLDVCRDDEVFWFDAGELDEFPADLPNADLTPEEQKNLELVMTTFDKTLDEETAAEPVGRLDRMANHIVRHHPSFVRVLDRAVYRSKLDAA
jgi:Zn-finger nucleic acid-binding protein